MARGTGIPPVVRLLLLASLLLSAPAFSRGLLNSRDNYYQDDLNDTADLDLVQALVVNPGGYLEVAASWTWCSPGKAPANILAHSTRFSVPGSATQFTTIEAGGTYGEQITLVSRWFSAVSDMSWSTYTGCNSGDSTKTCLVRPIQSYPVESGFGARSSSVLRVPSVNRFSGCKSPFCVTNYMVATLTLPQKQWKDLMVPGFPYSATFFLRYPGAGGPPVTPNRLAKIIAYFDNGAGNEYLGGATAGCADNTIGAGCQDRGNNGCPFNLVTDTPGAKGDQEFYLGDIYNPFTYSFCAGKIITVDPTMPNDWQPVCSRCQATPAYSACLDPIVGNWQFLVKVDTIGSPCDTISCGNDLADAPIYYDGLKITVGGVRIGTPAQILTTVHEDAGSYVSPVFDSLSAFTQWGNISWDVEQNRDTAAWARTPVRLKWRAGLTPIPEVLPYWVAAGSDHYVDMLPFTSSGQGMPDSGSSTLFNGAAATTGRYFQYELNLTSWSENLLNRPGRRSVGDYKSCVRYPIGYDGTLLPVVRQVTVSFIPDAGQLVSRPISPAKLRAWKSLRFEKEDGGGTVVMDILDADNNVILAGVTNGEPLNGLDPGKYPAIRVRATLRKNGVGGAAPRINWFKLDYVPQDDLLSINQNSLRLASNDEVMVRIFVEKSGMVELRIYDAAGQMVKGVFRGEVKGPQMLQVAWNGRDARGGSVAPGVYFVTAITPAGRQTGRIAVAR